MNRGTFIVFEGIDGCGKGTQLILGAKYLFNLSKEFDLYITREPTRDFKEIRERMRTSTDVKRDPEWYAERFVEDRRNHVDKYIEPILQRGTHVISDRYKDSTLAYQHTQGMPLSVLLHMHKGILIPDMTLLYDCPAEIAFERRKKEGATDVFDKDLEFQKQLRNNYLKLSEYLPNERRVIIDGSKSIDDVFAQTKSALDDLFRNHPSIARNN